MVVVLTGFASRLGGWIRAVQGLEGGPERAGLPVQSRVGRTPTVMPSKTLCRRERVLSKHNEISPNGTDRTARNGLGAIDFWTC